MARWGKLTYAQKQCVAATGKLMQQSEMVHPGARIGLAVSGGVDSFVLLQVMLIRQAIMPFDVELMVLHVNPGFDAESHVPLTEWCAQNGVPAHIELTDFGPRGHSEENLKRSACFYCARLRRKRLFELCRQYGLTHLAMGHNADDQVTTFFMNLFLNGRADGMAHNEPFFDGRLHVIRPMMLVEKATVKTAARQWGLPIWPNICPSNGATKRDEIRQWLENTWKGDRRMKNNVFHGLCRLQLDLDLKKK